MLARAARWDGLVCNRPQQFPPKCRNHRIRVMSWREKFQFYQILCRHVDLVAAYVQLSGHLITTIPI